LKPQPDALADVSIVQFDALMTKSYPIVRPFCGGDLSSSADMTGARITTIIDHYKYYIRTMRATSRRTRGRNAIF
jgi:hypothetical protein